jgi:hypothetical protein
VTAADVNFNLFLYELKSITAGDLPYLPALLVISFALPRSKFNDLFTSLELTFERILSQLNDDTLDTLISGIGNEYMMFFRVFQQQMIKVRVKNSAFLLKKEH